MEMGQQQKELDALQSFKEEIVRIFSGGKDPKNMNVQELLTLELKLNEVVLLIKERKIQILTQQVEQSRMQEPKVMDDLKEEISKLVIQQLSLLGKDLTDGMFSQAIGMLEGGLNEGLLTIWNTKKQMLAQHLEQPSMQEPKVVDGLKEEITNLLIHQLLLFGKDVTGVMSVQELGTLEHGLNDGLQSIWNTKQQMLTQQLEQSRMKEQQAMQLIETLRREADIIRGSFPSTSSGSATDVSNTNLHLGPSSGTGLKRKTPDGETQG